MYREREEGNQMKMNFLMLKEWGTSGRGGMD
jgi:hypothetical protein